MGVSTNWDGTLSQADFYVSGQSLCEKWKALCPTSPPWTWISCPRSFGVASHHEAEGYLSLDNLPCTRSIEGDDDNGDYMMNESISSTEEEISDDATLVDSSDERLHFYNLHIVWSTSYRVPVLYFRGYHSDGRPLGSDDIEKDLPQQSSKMMKDSRWTFMTLEEHPYLNRPWHVLHPCGTSEWMKLLLVGGASATEGANIMGQYLLSWLSVVGQVVPLRIPLGVFKQYDNALQIITSDPRCKSLFPLPLAGSISPCARPTEV